MFQLNTALAKEKKSSEKLGVNAKLAKNAKKSGKNPSTLEKGLDNRKDILHNPASQDLKLKWFHLPNAASGNYASKKSEGEDRGESVKEIADLDSFKMALNTAREAMASALPWNRSVSAVTGLMVNTNYCTCRRS